MTNSNKFENVVFLAMEFGLNNTGFEEVDLWNVCGSVVTGTTFLDVTLWGFGETCYDLLEMLDTM